MKRDYEDWKWLFTGWRVVSGGVGGVFLFCFINLTGQISFAAFKNLSEESHIIVCNTVFNSDIFI